MVPSIPLGPFVLRPLVLHRREIEAYLKTSIQSIT